MRRLNSERRPLRAASVRVIATGNESGQPAPAVEVARLTAAPPGWLKRLALLATRIAEDEAGVA
jgi:hypothetical protein